MRFLPPRHGLHIRYFALYDFGCLTALVALWLLNFKGDHYSWTIWTDAFYLCIVYSLLMLPFVVLAIPLVNRLITDTTPTGFDKSGVIGGVLSPAQIKRVRENAREMQKQAIRSHSVGAEALV